MKTLLCLLLTACATQPVETATWECTLFTTCGVEYDASTTTYCGTQDDVEQWAGEWDASCQQLTEYLVRTRQCPYVVCEVRCPAAKSVTAVCDS